MGAHKSKEHNAEVRAATRFLLDDVIPSLGAQLNARFSGWNGALTRELPLSLAGIEREGVNLRLFGHLRAACRLPSQFPDFCCWWESCCLFRADTPPSCPPSLPPHTHPRSHTISVDGASCVVLCLYLPAVRRWLLTEICAHAFRDILDGALREKGVTEALVKVLGVMV